MFEAYKIGVKISLINNVSSGLLTMSNQMIGLSGNAKTLEKDLNRIKLLGLAGGAMSAAGFMGLGIVGKMLKPAQEYAHQLNIINMAGWTQRDIATAVGDAWKNTSTVITSTATGNLKTLLDLKNVLGTFGEARMALPFVSKVQSVLGASSDAKLSGNSQDLAYSMAKALDVIGAGTNKANFERQGELMSKVIIATQGRVLPEMFKSTFVYARQAAPRLSDEFKYQIMPTLMQEIAGAGGGGGGSRGLGPALAAFYRWSNQGFVNKQSLPQLAALGLVDPRTAIKTTTGGTTVGAMTGADLAASNPFAWTQSVLIPALQKKYGGNLSTDELVKHAGEILRGNQGAAWLIGQFITKPQNFMRDKQNIVNTMSTSDAYKAAISNDPNTAFAALSAQWTNFKTSFMMGVIPVLIPALIKLTDMFNGMANWARSNPNLAGILANGFIALSASLAFGGAVILATQAFRGLGLALAFSSVGGAAGIASIATKLPLFAAGLAAVSGTLLMYAAPLAAAGFAGWKAGGWVNNHLSNGTKDGIGRGIAHALAFFGNQDAQNALNSESKFIASQKKGAVQVHTQINLDGRKVAESVSHHQAKSASRPSASQSTFDGTMSPRPLAMNGR